MNLGRRIANALGTALLTVLLFALPAPARSQSAESSRATAERFESSDVFVAGTGGYSVYRIPGIVVTKRGTLLAYAEARKDNASDWGNIDIVLRRSEDGGKTWDPQRLISRIPGPKTRNPVATEKKLGDPNAVGYNNPVAIVSRKSGAIHLVFCLEYMRAFYLRSDDDGKTFSKPIEITAAFEELRPVYNWRVLAAGPGHGIETKGGRLLIPVWLSTGTGGNGHRPSVVSTIYSDDEGATWHAGEIAVDNHGGDWNPSETVAVELADGRILLNVRTQSERNRRVIVTGPDGARGWSAPRFQEDLVEPICFGSIDRMSGAGDRRRSRILFVNPDNLLRGDAEGQPGQGRDRKNLTIQLSYDEGQSWSVKRTVDPGWSGYADIHAGPLGAIYCLYERGATGEARFRIAAITLTTVNLEWLTRGKDHWAEKPKKD